MVESKARIEIHQASSDTYEAPIPATQRALKKAGMKIDDIDLFEVNEAFASVPLAWLRATGADPERTNVNGGAIALGHPLGASGTKLMTTLIHALIQRAGNAYGAPMFVGTSNAVRIKAIKGIGGLYDSITEDMATGFELHRHRNPATGRTWRSVYTPDVLAVGEGPSAWTDFFTQQLRWSRGTYETVLKQFWKAPFTLPPGRLFNYTLLLVYYPTTALNWVLSALSCVLFLGFGASGIQVSSEIWLMLYGDAAALQIAQLNDERKATAMAGKS